MAKKISSPAMILALLAAASATFGQGAPERRINGEIRTVQNVSIIRVWGTPSEQGHAEGYLLAAKGLQLFDDYLGELGGPEAIQAYEATSLLAMQRMRIPRIYQDELEGIIEGIKEKMKGQLRVPSLGRDIEYRDLVAINCIPDTLRMGCSSFAAWGPLTKDGQTIVGRNLDWIYHDAMDGQQIVVARLPSGLDKRLATVTLGWPWFIGCLTGMNAEGVTVSLHDAPGSSATDGARLTPRALALREALENAHAGTAIEEAARVLTQRTSAVGNNVPIAFPYDGKHSPAAVFEYDGNLNQEGGVTTRLAEAATGLPASLLICTNHYRKRGEPTACDRYERIDNRLKEALKAGRTIDVSEAWRILKSVEVAGRVFTFHSVVFEPNQMRMHVAFSSDSSPAPEQRPVELDVHDLLLASRSARR